MDITVGQYLLKRLSEVGIGHVFGVPGDYNLGFLDLIDEDPNLEWMGACNELNASYAADGYARIKGLSALVTTYGVGEMSAINGVAGAFSEYVPLINIVGMPSSAIKNQDIIMHHTLPEKPYDVFYTMFKELTVMQCILDEARAAEMIDKAILTCWQKKRPVYIGLPSDIVLKKIKAPKLPLKLEYPKSKKDALKEAVEICTNLIEKAKKPVILMDLCSARHKMYPLVEKLINKTSIPFGSMNLAKGVLDETHPLFLGDYSGDVGSQYAKEYIESSDCILTFGLTYSDFNTGGFTARLNPNTSIQIHSSYIRIKQALYQDVYFNELIVELTKSLKKNEKRPKIQSPKTKPFHASEPEISQIRFWERMGHFLEKDMVVIAEVGTSMFGALSMKLPSNTLYISQYLWASIGYSVGALFGTLVASPKKEQILFVGDGSFQLTAQELSSIIRHKYSPIIFLLNNDGYTIERVIHGPDREYNCIQMWDYKEVPKLFGKNVWSVKVKSEKDLEEALKEAKKHPKKLRFIEVVMDKMDAPESLIEVAKGCAKINRYAS